MKKIFFGALILLALLSVDYRKAAFAAPQSFTITFQDNSDNEDGFTLERCTGVNCTNFALLTTLGANVTNYVDAGLPEKTMFCYRVSAFNSAGSSSFAGPTCQTTPVTIPNAPSVLMVK